MIEKHVFLVVAEETHNSALFPFDQFFTYFGKTYRNVNIVFVILVDSVLNECRATSFTQNVCNILKTYVGFSVFLLVFYGLFNKKPEKNHKILENT